VAYLQCGSSLIKVNTIRSCERDHLQALWADRLAQLDWEYERDSLEDNSDQRLIADGGQDIREWIRERIDAHIDLDDASEQTNPWSSKSHVRQDIQYHQFGRQEVVEEIEVSKYRSFEDQYWVLVRLLAENRTPSVLTTLANILDFSSPILKHRIRIALVSHADSGYLQVVCAGDS
jgi:hypothetical protein